MNGTVHIYMCVSISTVNSTATRDTRHATHDDCGLWTVDDDVGATRARCVREGARDARERDAQGDANVDDDDDDVYDDDDDGCARRVGWNIDLDVDVDGDDDDALGVDGVADGDINSGAVRWIFSDDDVRVGGEGGGDARGGEDVAAREV